MPPPVLAFLVLFAVLVAYLVVQAKRAGPRQLPGLDLERAILVRSATREDPGSGWSQLGSKTTARGLDLKFDHDDDPQAEASFFVEAGPGRTGSSLANRMTVRLGPDFETHHVHTRGYVFRVRLRGTEPVMGKEVRIQMHVGGDGRPIGGRVENDDDTDAAVGGWIEVASVEVLRVGGR